MIRNPSRAPPQDIILRTVGGASGRFNLYLDTKPPRPLIAYSAGYLEHSQLLSTEGSPLAHRYIRMIFHTQEWERFLGFITTATGFPSLHAQLGQDALQFSTRPQPSSGTTPGKFFKRNLCIVVIADFRLPRSERKRQSEK